MQWELQKFDCWMNAFKVLVSALRSHQLTTSMFQKAFSLQIREKNMYDEEGDCTPFGTHLHQCNIRRCWNECLLLSDYNKRLQAINEFNRFILVQFKRLSFGDAFSCQIFDIRDDAKIEKAKHLHAAVKTNVLDLHSIRTENFDFLTTLPVYWVSLNRWRSECLRRLWFVSSLRICIWPFNLLI